MRQGNANALQYLVTQYAPAYALDATTIDLCLFLFEWAPFRKTKAAVKMHMLLEWRCAIPAFIYIGDGKMHEATPSSSGAKVQPGLFLYT